MVIQPPTCEEVLNTFRTDGDISDWREVGCVRPKRKLREQCVSKREFGNKVLLITIFAVVAVGSSPCRAQDDTAAVNGEAETVSQADTEADAGHEQKQRTAASALATLAGIALAGVGLIFVILLLGAWTRRRAKARSGDRRTSPDELPPPAARSGTADRSDAGEDQA